ncbi:MAG: hypothetical protein ACNA71_05345 [Kiritimatiellia bacterium]
MRLVLFIVLLSVFGGLSLPGQDLYRDWNRRVCPVLDTPFRTHGGWDIAHTLRTDTDAPGWGDGVSVTDIGFWGRLPTWENDFGGELEVRGHADFRLLEGLESGSGIDRQHGFMMLRGVVTWHQRYLGGFGMQTRIQPGVYTALSNPSGNLFAVPVGATFIQALSADFAIFAGVDYYPNFMVEFDPVVGVLYSLYNELWVQVAYPHTRVTMRPYGGRFQFGVGADFTRWPEYSLGADDERERLRFRENQAYVELSWDTRGFTQIDLRLGYVFGRKAIFEEGLSVDFDDAPLASLGFRAML